MIVPIVIVRIELRENSKPVIKTSSESNVRTVIGIMVRIVVIIAWVIYIYSEPLDLRLKLWAPRMGP